MVEEPDCSPDGPRNIVLLSDGTGNSSASLRRTNVWRMYEALDLSTGAQLALYDNGVGTSMFRPLAILGGAIGWGLKRNVRDLYVFVCRNYLAAQHDDQGKTTRQADRIYAMGFSRGAFTIRVLIDLIGHQGLITGATGRELDRKAKWAYREYRRQFKSRLSIVSLFRWMRDQALHVIEWGKPRYDSTKNDHAVTVTFMGLWDTVDAYGLPMDEMTRGWDQWVWPLKMDSHRPPRHVKKICHAIALDDERHTFHPVLLDENGLEEVDHTDKEDVTQVWFAGVHSNVGGSYPDDSLAHVPLRWMAAKACKKGLRLHDVDTATWKARSDPHGPIYDSRRGLASYYRYNPRLIERLSDDQFAQVTIKRPKIHCSVFQRIAAGRDEYAPIVLPDRYAVVTENGDIVESDASVEGAAQAAERALAQERVWDRVWIRRVLYFATVITTLIVVLPPLVLDEDSPGLLPFPWPRSRFLENVVDLLGKAVPATLQPGIEYYRTKADQLIVPAVAILLLMLASTRVQRAAADRMREIWTGRGKRGQPHGLIYKLRKHAAYRWTFQIVTQYVFPFVFGMLALGIVALSVAGTVNRGAFTLANAAGWICPAPEQTTPLKKITEATPLQFDNTNPCSFTGVELESGVPYRATMKIGRKDSQQQFIETGVWKDKGQSVDSPEGFSTGDNFFVAPFLPFRRVLTARWFVPIIRIGDYGNLRESHGVEYHLLNTKEPVDFTPRISGPMVLFVNDAIGPLPWWRFFYDNNDGGIGQVTIEKRADTTSAAQQ
jgi:uncharacterized protein (DUF2235 family)